MSGRSRLLRAVARHLRAVEGGPMPRLAHVALAVSTVRGNGVGGIALRGLPRWARTIRRIGAPLFDGGPRG